ncbi:MAG: TolC family protein [Candidatus Dadabacteria bacterium]|nr:TolC family protein [Candidatus Dadabacteria bacterium]NIQ16652.1 TolC family protein [Candidatus Dadabacteria bacterium]
MSEATTRKVIAELKSVYFDWFFINKSIEITQNNKGLLSKFAKVAEVKYEVGNGIQQDVLKAQVEVSRFIERLELLNEKNKILEFKINKILNRPLNSHLGDPQKVVKTEFKLTLDEISNLTLQNAPIIKSSIDFVDSKEESLNLAGMQYLPDFLVGATYFNRSGGSQDLDDLWQLSLGLRVPLYFWKKERFGVEEASFDLLEAKNNHTSVSNNIMFKVKDSFITAKTAEKLLDLYSSGIIPQSSLSLESAISGYQVGDVDFLTLLNNLVTLFNFELEYYNQLTVFQKALVEIEELSGLEIIGIQSIPETNKKYKGENLDE